MLTLNSELLKPGKTGVTYEPLLVQIAKQLSDKDRNAGKSEFLDIDRMTSTAASSLGNILKSGIR